MPSTETQITSDNAREMQAKAAESRRKKREEAEKMAADKQDEILGAALALHVTLLGDPEARAQAAPLIREAYDRYLGKPKERVELSGEDGSPIQIVVRSAFDADDDPGSPVHSDDTAKRPSEGMD